MNKTIITTIILVLVAGAGGFYGGMKYSAANSNAAGGQGLTQQQRQARFQQMGANGVGAGRVGGAGAGTRGGNMINGDIISKDDKSITLKLSDGGSKIIFYSPNVQIEKTATGKPSDLEVGKSVSVNGQTNPDGSVVAQTIRFRPNLPNQPQPPKQ